VGTVTEIIREQSGWERVYPLLPAANPGSAAHVLVLVSPARANLAAAFPSDSALRAMRLDSLDRIRRADSAAQAAREAKLLADSLLAARRDSLRRLRALRPVRRDTAAAAPAQPAPPLARDTTRPPAAPAAPAASDSAR